MPSYTGACCTDGNPLVNGSQEPPKALPQVPNRGAPHPSPAADLLLSSLLQRLRPERTLLRKGALHRCKSAMVNGPQGLPQEPSKALPKPPTEGPKGPSDCGFAPVKPSAENAPWRALLRKGALHRCKSALANCSQRPPEALPKPQERCLTTLPSDGFAHFHPFAGTATQSTGKRPKICYIPVLTCKTLR